MNNIKNNLDFLQNINQSGGNKAIKIVIVVIIVILFGVGGFLIYKSLNKKNDDSGNDDSGNDDSGNDDSGNDDSGNDDSGDDDTEWKSDKGNCISGCVSNPDKDGTCREPNFDTIEDAKNACINNDDCDGVYLNKNNKYEQRKYCGDAIDKFSNATKIIDANGKVTGGTYSWCDKTINKDKRSCNKGQGGVSYFKP